MALVKCPECNKDVSTYASTCPHCGFPMDKAPAQPKKKDFPHKKLLNDLFDAFEKKTLTTDHPLFAKMTKVSGDFSRNEEAYQIICNELEKRRYLGLPNDIVSLLKGKYLDYNYGINLVSILRDEVRKREFNIEFGDLKWKTIEDGYVGKTLMCEAYYSLEYEMWPNFEKPYLQSPLHDFLNHNFLEEHFLWIEIENMKQKKIMDENNSSSEDLVFLRSKEEVGRYFPNPMTRAAGQSIVTRSIIKKTRREIYQVLYASDNEKETGLIFSTPFGGGYFRPCIAVDRSYAIAYSKVDLFREIEIYKNKLQEFLSKLMERGALSGMYGRKQQLEKELKNAIDSLVKTADMFKAVSLSADEVKKYCWGYKKRYLVFKKEFIAVRRGN